MNGMVYGNPGLAMSHAQHGLQGNSGNISSMPGQASHSGHTSNIPPPRPKLTTTLWEDEGTLCYQVDARGICVARRQGMSVGIFRVGVARREKLSAWGSFVLFIYCWGRKSVVDFILFFFVSFIF